MKHVISSNQFLDPALLQRIFKSANQLEKKSKSGTLLSDLQGKIVATLFFEPSTRTRLSFEAATLKLGGQVLSCENAAQFSSASKGETLEDMIQVVGGYADAIVLRHPEKGSSQIAAEASLVPLINAGDGSGEHPTQALLDLYTIEKELGRLSDLTITIVGDLLYGRTVHSLLPLFTSLKNVTINLVSPKELALPAEYKKSLGENVKDFTSLEETLPKTDVFYITRIQKERFSDMKKYEKVRNSFVLDLKIVQKMLKSAIILHPLPRVGEINPEIDQDVRAAYFRQAQNGIWVRMALLKELLTS